MSYTRTREIVLQAFAELGYPKHLFGLHSLLEQEVLPQPLTQALVIGFLNVTADGGLIGPKMAILRIVWNHYFQCRKVCILSFLCSLSLFSKRASINEMPAPDAVFWLFKISYKMFYNRFWMIRV